jgi:hypothetical protein
MLDELFRGQRSGGDLLYRLNGVDQTIPVEWAVAKGRGSVQDARRRLAARRAGKPDRKRSSRAQFFGLRADSILGRGVTRVSSGNVLERRKTECIPGPKRTGFESQRELWRPIRG